MFSIFKKPSEESKLRKEYKKLMEASFQLAKTDRIASDLKRKEAEEIMDRLEALKSNG